VATPEPQLAVDVSPVFATVLLRTLGVARSALLIAFEPARVAVRVIAVTIRLIELLQILFRVRLAIAFELRYRVKRTYNAIGIMMGIDPLGFVYAIINIRKMRAANCCARHCFALTCKQA
jgi:hypothetical protein